MIEVGGLEVDAAYGERPATSAGEFEDTFVVRRRDSLGADEVMEVLPGA